MLVSHGNVHLLAHGQDVLIPHAAKRLWVLLKGEVCGAPLFEQGGQDIRRLAADHKQAGVEFSQTGVQVFQTLEQKSRQGKVMNDMNYIDNMLD